MAKAELKIDIKQGPALKALLRMVGAFGAGVQPGTEQSAALIEAYTVIQNAMVSEANKLLPATNSSEIRATIEGNNGNYADVVLKKGWRSGTEKLHGRIDVKAGKGWFYLRSDADNYVMFDEVAHVTIVKSVFPNWTGNGEDIVTYVRKNKKKRVRITFIDRHRFAVTGTIDRIGSDEYFWLLEEQTSDITRYRNAINFVDIERITLCEE